ncbi:tRNA dihydrouridine synthase DusB [Saccharothrix isguenensis]
MSTALHATQPLKIGRYPVDPAVVLAPMAGITNVAFRQLCREFGSPTSLYVCEMITARAIVERDAKTMQMITFGEGERPRSMQLYGVDPKSMAEAARIIVAEDRADHIDMNFGCPVPKVTRKGGGAALPYKRQLFRQIVRAAVRAGEPAGVPVTVKFRIGIDDDHLTYLDAGRIAEDEGAQAVALHARTAAQRYSGQADWSAIARLKEAVTSIPVLGNGDIFSAQDALDMVAKTGCDGVVVGRGCLGRPWLFGELQAAFRGEPIPPGPPLGQVAAILRRHGALLADFLGEDKGIRDLRKHMAWYLKGFPVGAELRRSLAMVSTLAELDDLVGRLDPTLEFPDNADEPRGRQGSPGKVVLPEGWLDDPEDATVPVGADEMHSGG